jgi:Glycosyl hydrolase family 115/Gylcosyl hydrolase family 115 C-terminal domain
VNRPIPCLALIAAGLFSSAVPVLALGGVSCVSDLPVDGGFGLATSAGAAPVFVADGDFAGVVLAAGSFCGDVEKVTGRRPGLVTAGKDPNGDVVIVGTIGHSALVDGLARSGKIDTAQVAGRWEAYLTQVVDNPMPGVARALVIAGSDKRGTIFGIYAMSEQIGVSPWYWWADVPVRHRERLFVVPGKWVEGGPAVKYRGIFLNDEAPALTGWVKERYGGYTHLFYTTVFELLLRLRANTLWPAMWNSAFNEDDPDNARLADVYGIVMSTSHHEPMLRAQQEWKRHGQGPWDYTANGAELRDFWRQGVRRNKAYESLYTVGMRGDGDKPMSRDNNVALLEHIVADQREILKEEVNPDITKIPQVWALYKEVQSYYEQGMRVPDDVTLLWSDDNFGNLRRVPTDSERSRAGGAGIYYHFDYVGGPRSYKWICTVPTTKVWEQMNLAYRYGANRLWIVNVGDLKPMELDIDFFLSLAWSPDAWPRERIGEFTRLWAAREFGPDHADEIARIEMAYLKFIGRRKPEVTDTGTYNLVNYGEADRVTAEYRDLVERAEAVSKQLPMEMRDAYFQLVLFPVRASAQVAELYIAAGRNQMYARQGRALANVMAERTRALFQADRDLTTAYNTVLSGGKWQHMMDQTHLGYTYWNEPPKDTIPALQEITIPEPAAIALAVDGSTEAWPGALGSCELPQFDGFNRQTSFVDVFNRGRTAFDFTAAADRPWIHVRAGSGAGTGSISGRVDGEMRVWVDIDWSRAPEGDSRGNIVFSQVNGQSVTVGVEVSRTATPSGTDEPGFVESGGVVSIEAEHSTGQRDESGVGWRPIADYGRTLSSMTLFPVTAASAAPPHAPLLEYRVYVKNGSAGTVEAYLAPSLPILPGRGLRYAISVDDAAPSIVDVATDPSKPEWARSVEDNVRIGRTPITLSGAGAHVLKVWGIDPGLVLEKIVVNLGGEMPSYLGPPESFFWRPATASVSP